MEFIKQSIDDVAVLLAKPRQLIQQTLNVGCVICGAFMLWKLCMVVTNCPAPIVVVLSGSMEPAFYRGDVLFLHQPEVLRVGDVTVFELSGREIPIVHRLVNLHEDYTGKTVLLTKGDNNEVDDRSLYGETWLDKEKVFGVVRGYAPQAGMITIWLNEHLWIKYTVVGSLGFLLFMGKD